MQRAHPMIEVAHLKIRPTTNALSSPAQAPSRRGLVGRTRATRRLASTALMFIGAGLLSWSAAIHLHLWMNGYRHIPTIGPLFLLQAIGGFVIAIAVVATRRTLVALAAVGFLASTIGGLVLSASVGLFGFRDGFDAPFAQMSLIVEGIAIGVLLAAAVLRRGAPGNPGQLHLETLSREAVDDKNGSAPGGRR